MNLRLRFRIWLSGVIYPGHSRGLIKHDELGWFVANIKFEGVMVSKLDHGIVISVHDVDLSPHESLMLVRNEFANSLFAELAVDDDISIATATPSEKQADLDRAGDALHAAAIGYLSGGGWPSERLRRVDSGEDTPEEFVAHSRRFEEHMTQKIGSMGIDEWLEHHATEAKKRGFD